MVSEKKNMTKVQTESQVEYSGFEELLNIEENLPRYNLGIVRKIAIGLGLKSTESKNNQIVDFGAGSGTLAEIWRKLYKIEPICIEIDPSLIHILKSKNFQTLSSIQRLNWKASYVYSSNVLEHIEDDVGALKKIREKMEPGGKLAVYVPALPFLFSDLDRAVGHFRRYKRNELISKVELAGFQVSECYYNDSLGVLATISMKILGYKRMNGLGSKRWLLVYDTYIYPVSRILDRFLCKYWVGKNLIIFASNPLA